MSEGVEVTECVEILFAVEGAEQHRSASAHREITVAEFAVIAAKDGGLVEEVEVFLEDGDEPLTPDRKLIECLPVEFAPLHVASKGHIAVTVRYGGKEIEHPFRPAATIGKITVYAMGPHGFKLEGSPSDYQLKHDGKVLAPDVHVGQVARHKKVTLDLVFKVKPQG